jgi:hypothetical protein
MLVQQPSVLTCPNVCDTLGSGMMVEFACHHEVEHRSDELCEWIVLEPTFVSWKDDWIDTIAKDA